MLGLLRDAVGWKRSLKKLPTEGESELVRGRETNSWPNKLKEWTDRVILEFDEELYSLSQNRVDMARPPAASSAVLPLGA
jgi:hypothetical protein